MRKLFFIKECDTYFRNLFLIAFSCMSLGASGQGVSIDVQKQLPKEANGWLTPSPSFQLFENTTHYFVREISSHPIGSFHAPLAPSLTDQVIPAYAQENPSGYTYLCRMELEVEKNLPVPLWIRAGKVNGWETYNSTAMYVQVKLLGFKK